MVSSLSPKAHRMLDDMEGAYAYWWGKKSATYQKQGLYDSIAEAVGDVNRGIHLDVGTGLGHLLHAIRVRCQRATLIGIERNPQMVRRGHHDMQVVGGCEPRQIVDGLIRRRFTTGDKPIPALKQSFLIQE